jgi:hypothetical protein
MTASEDPAMFDDPDVTTEWGGSQRRRVTLQIYSHRSTGQDRDVGQTFAAGLFGIVDGIEGPQEG